MIAVIEFVVAVDLVVSTESNGAGVVVHTVVMAWVLTIGDGVAESGTI